MGPCFRNAFAGATADFFPAVPQCVRRDDTGRSCRSQGVAFSRRGASEFFNQHTLITKRGRREGRVSADTHGPRATRKARGRTTGSAGTSGLPCAMVLRLIACSPRGPGFLATVTRKMPKHLCGLSASVGAPGPHDFAVRDNIIRLVTRRVHRIPRPTFVTIAKRPSCECRTRG
jgi:hypothetical protein